MTVTLSTYGGLAAGIRRLPRTVKSSNLAEPVAAELRQLVTAAKAAPSVKEERPGRARDAVSYTIRVEEDGGEIFTMSQSDATMSPAFAALLEWLDRHSVGK
jgi:hypothetical protein